MISRIRRARWIFGSIVMSSVAALAQLPDPTTPQATAPTADAPTTTPTTQSTTQPASRVEKFKVRLSRTPLATLKALSAAPDPRADESAKFTADVLAGRWDAVGQTLATFAPAEGKQLYLHLITELASTGQPQRVTPEMAARVAAMQAAGAAGVSAPGGESFLAPEDVLALIEASPGDIEDDLIETLGQLMGRAIVKTNVVEPVSTRLEKGIHNIGGAEPANRVRAASLLVAANRPVEAGAFLPPIDGDLHAIDSKLLDLHSRHLAAVATQDAKDSAAATRAWDVTRSLLSHPRASQKERDAAMTRALELLPKMPKQAAADWLDEGFTKNPDHGMAVLTSAGTAVSQNFQNRDVERRYRELIQQKSVVDQLLANEIDSPRWAPALSALAALWMQEADYARQRPSMKQMMAMQRQRYMSPDGAVMYAGQNPNELPPVDPAKLLECAPSEKWIAALDPSMRAAVRFLVVHMHFKNDAPVEALPVIETLAPSHPKLARDLAAELLGNMSRVWSASQAMSRQQQMYMINMYGSMQGMMPAVQTRSSQMRNLKELAAALRRFENLSIAPPDRTAVATAFVSAHSQAEVFRLDDVETVFGPVDSIDGETFFRLMQTMRQRLATTWRSPAVQQQAQTKRTDKETDAEVTRGYELMTQVLEQRHAKSPDYKTGVLLASAHFDWAEFDYGKGTELAIYTARRDRAFELFAQSSSQYHAALPQLKPAEQSSMVYQQWFNAALGASDLSALTRQATPSPTQLQQIRAALLAAPDDSIERHLADFGKWLSDSVNQLRPEIKHRFLSSGVQVVGDHPSAADAREMVRYYEDLLTEVELHAQVDGDAVIGHAQPFGVHLLLRHSQTLGRETGGFNKYLTNQQSGVARYYASSLVSQPINYRDEIEKKVREALADRFDIVSVTFHEETVQPMSFGKPGWRQTPLAYVLLKPKDASVDKIPPVQMDIDIPDRTNLVILPIASQVVLIDARPDKGTPRPLTNVEITQILDHREAAAGKVSLDIKTTACGLVPELSDLLDVKIAGFKVDKITDQGLSVSKLDATGEAPVALSERSWVISLVRDASADTAMTFKFPRPRQEAFKVAYKQFLDADVSDVDPDAAVAGMPLTAANRRPATVIALTVIVLAAVAASIAARRRRSQPLVESRYRVPPTLTPFTVIELLKRIEGDTSLGLSPDHRDQLTQQVMQLEHSYFAPARQNDAKPDISAIASHWVRRAQPPSGF